jgi:hypothetical protein
MVAQVALSVLLLIAAGLFVRSLRHARSIDPGFEAAGILTASVDLETHGYSESRGRALIQSLTRRLEAVPGITGLNVADIVPVTLSNSTTFLLRDADAPPAMGQRPPTPPIYTNAVAAGHFRTLRIRCSPDVTSAIGTTLRHTRGDRQRDAGSNLLAGESRVGSAPAAVAERASSSRSSESFATPAT